MSADMWRNEAGGHSETEEPAKDPLGAQRQALQLRRFTGVLPECPAGCWSSRDDALWVSYIPAAS